MSEKVVSLKQFSDLWREKILEEVLAFKPEDKGFVSVPYDSNLSQALHLMSEHHLISLPVMDKDRCVGVVDNIDILNFLVDQLREVEEWASWSTAKFEKVLENVQLKEVLNLSQGDPLLIASSKTTLLSIMKFFSSGLSHRCIVHVGDLGFAVCSQIDVVKFISSFLEKNNGLFEEFERILAKDAIVNRSIDGNIVSINWNECVFKAMKLMKDEQVSGVALVDPENHNKLVGNFSASDLLNLEHCAISELNLPLKDFLKKYSRMSLTPIAVVKHDTPLGDVIVLLGNLGVHRLWLVEPERKSDVFQPQGVITLTDVLRAISQI